MKTLTKEYRHIVSNTQRRETARLCKSSLSEELRDTYTKKYCEGGNLREYTDIAGSEDVRIVKYKDLPDVEIAGYPYAVDWDENGDLRCHFSLASPAVHELVVGTTGCGKTTCCVEPRLRILSSKKNRSNLFITDVKGELFEHNAEHLRKRGYQIYLLNFKDVLHSDCWNPLAEIYDSWMRQKAAVETLTGRRLEDAMAEIQSETADLVYQIVHTLIPDTMLSKTDPSWFMGAQEILSSIIYAMLEDALDPRAGFTRDNMNLQTVQEYFDAIRTAVMNPNGTNTPLLKTKKLAHKKAGDISIKQMRSYLETAPTTSRCYCGCLRNAMQGWFNSKIFTVTNGQTVEIIPDGEKPFAVFLTVRDYEKSDYAIASLFIDFVYRKLLTYADRHHGKMTRETFLLLDEFTNSSPIRDFENKIATSRSRNIFFHMFIQSYAQLSDVYGPAAAQTIMDNCNSHVFLGSQNYETRARFAKECGKQAIPSLESVLSPAANRIVEVPLLTIEKLESLTLGQMYTKRAGMPVLLAECVPSYQCGEFAGERMMSPEEMGIESLPYNSEKYRYAYLETNLSMEEFSQYKGMMGRREPAEHLAVPM